eukprot:TRINITY_DN1143_c0_g6_i2.p1 TRINITY_DN1143_c0_g6~~TRINITY_DN1143_c0_g6_i2.p1  ORF type:complete len:500 (-),score=52.21 TRINITY_DN1143_c0_g6_i2:156-1655(-)
MLSCVTYCSCSYSCPLFPISHVVLYHILTFSTPNEEAVAFYESIVEMGVLGNSQFPFSLTILIFTVIALALNLAAATMIIMEATGILIVWLFILGKGPDLSIVANWLDMSLVCVHFGLMTIITIFGQTGFFPWLAVKGYKASRGNVKLLFVIITGTCAIFSAWLEHSVSLMLLGPVTVTMCNMLDLNPIPFLFGQTLLSNIGGTATLIGDPPNLILGAYYGFGFVDFLVYVGPGIVIIYLTMTGYLMWYYKDMLKGTINRPVPSLTKHTKLQDIGLVIKCCLVTLSVLILFFLSSFLHFDPAWASLTCATALLIITRVSKKELDHIYTEIEWVEIFFLVIIFVFAGALSELGFLEYLGRLANPLAEIEHQGNRLMAAITAILWISAFFSGAFNGIAFAALFVSILGRIAEDANLPVAPLVWSCVLGVSLGCNLTLYASATNMVMAHVLHEHAHIHISYWHFLKVGAPVTFMSLVMANIYLWIVWVGIAGYNGETFTFTN